MCWCLINHLRKPTNTAHAAIKIGMPIGKNEIEIKHSTPPSAAACRPSFDRRCGNNITMNAAGNAISKPNFCGSIALPAKAPIRVPRFQKLNRPIPVVQKAIFRSRGDYWASASAVVSSITKCAAKIRRGRLPAIDFADDESARP